MSFTSTRPSAVNDRGYNSAWFALAAIDDLSREKHQTYQYLHAMNLK